MLSAVLLIALTFVIGGIPTGYWTVKALKGVDLRTVGSGSTGATNVWRAAGKSAAIFVFFFDTFKGYAPAALAHWLDQGPMLSEWSFAHHLVPPLVAAAALVGHSKSVFLGFQGGKSAATGLGTLIGLQPLGGGLTFVVWLLVLFVTKYVSVASIIGVFSCPFWFAMLHSPIPDVCYCVFGFIYVTYRHKSNLQRLMKGTEPKINEKKKDPPAAPPPAGEAQTEQIP